MLKVNEPVIYPGYVPVNRRVWKEMVIVRIDHLMRRYGYPPMDGMTLGQFERASQHVRDDIRLWLEENIGSRTQDNRDGTWKVLPPCYYFKNSRDAILFKIRWC